LERVKISLMPNLCRSSFNLVGSILALFAEPLDFSSLTLYLGLVGVHLQLLIPLLDLLSLELVANQRASTQPLRATDSGTRARMTYCSTDDSTRGSAAERANAGPFLARRQIPARTAKCCA
jgi:hypothetical protein